MGDTSTTRERAKKPHRTLWFANMFDQFSSSDVLSNYTRTYAWMANQLGHMALGLLTVFLFIWITETLETAHALWASPAQIAGPVAMTRQAPQLGIMLIFAALYLAILLLQRFVLPGSILSRRDKIWLCAIGVAAALIFGLLAGPGRNALLLFITTFVMGGAITAILYHSLSTKEIVDPELRNRMYLANRRRVFSVAALALLAFFCVSAKLSGYADTRFAPIAVWFLFIVTIMLMKDQRFLGVAFLASVIAVFISTDGFYLDRICQSASDAFIPCLSSRDAAPAGAFDPNGLYRRAGGIALAIILVIVLAFALKRQTDAPAIVQEERRQAGNLMEQLKDAHPHGHSFETPRGRRIVFIAGLCAACFLIIVTWEGLEKGWVLPVTGAIMSMTVWFTKEFASDLPNVHAELSNATTARARKLYALGRGIPNESQIRKAHTPKPIARAYFRDARWDSRTNGVFYFAGAWIAAGVSTTAPVLTTADAPGAWASGSELVGILIFVIFFLFFGQNWILRQKAVDRIGTHYANRLAVFDARIELSIAKTGVEISLPGDGIDESRRLDFETTHSLSILYDYARGWPNPADLALSRERKSVMTDKAFLNFDHHFSHLLVFGRHGYGKAPLGSALVTEASLYDLSPRPTFSLSASDLFGLGDRTDPVRTGRMVDAASLCEYGTRERRERHYQLREIASHPTRDLYFVPPDDPNAPPLPEAERPVTHNKQQDQNPLRRAASLIVIDNFDFSMGKRSMEGDQEVLAELDNIFFTLALHEKAIAKRAGSDGTPNLKHKQTVWLIRYSPKIVNEMDKGDYDAEEEPDPEELRVFIEWLRERITREAMQGADGSVPAQEDNTPCAIGYLRLSSATADTPKS